MDRDDKDPKQNFFKRVLDPNQRARVQDALELVEIVEKELEDVKGATLDFLKLQDVRDLERVKNFYQEALFDLKTGFEILDKLRRELHTHPHT